MIIKGKELLEAKEKNRWGSRERRNEIVWERGWREGKTIINLTDRKGNTKVKG